MLEVKRKSATPSHGIKTPGPNHVRVIGGSVTGDIVARERVELGPASKIHGNIWTRSIVIKDGAIFEGVCRMIEEAQKAN